MYAFGTFRRAGEQDSQGARSASERQARAGRTAARREHHVLGLLGYYEKIPIKKLNGQDDHPRGSKALERSQ
jgi:hypothetical protein